MYMYVYVCMLAIAGKTGGPNGLNFFRDFSSTSGVTKASIFFTIRFFKNSAGNAGHSS